MGNVEGMEEQPSNGNASSASKTKTKKKGEIEWVPDDSVTECARCKTKFTVANRRVRITR
jgi:hypothetical protein